MRVLVRGDLTEVRTTTYNFSWHHLAPRMFVEGEIKSNGVVFYPIPLLKTLNFAESGDGRTI